MWITRDSATTATFTTAVLKTVAVAGLAALALAGCGGSGSTPAAAGASPVTTASDQATAGSVGGAATPGTAVSGVASPPAASASAAAGSGGTAKPAAGGSGLEYQPIKEPFGPPGTCKQNGTTAQATNCVLEQVKSVDGQIDAAQRKKFESSAAHTQKAQLQDNAQFVKTRSAQCDQVAKTLGGAVGQIAVAQCLLQSSKARLKTLQG